MMWKFVAVAVMALGLVGCATVPMGDQSRDAEVKTFAAKPEVAGIYIYRNESWGGAVKMEVAIDGVPLGKTAAKTYLYTEVEPGKHSITSKAENTATLELEVAGGRLYYVWQEVKMGVLFARNKLHLVGEEEGQKGVLACRLAVAE